MGLTSEEGRVLGCLVEKQLTTPQLYPLTEIAVIAACNQTTSRDPVVAYDERSVLAAVDSLKAKGALRIVHPTSGRGVTRYRQVLDSPDRRVEELNPRLRVGLREPEVELVLARREM